MIGLLPTEHWDYKTSDIIRAVTSLLRPREQSKTLDIAGIGSCITTRSGRTAIVAAIRALELPPGARIGVPLYSCPVVFKAIEAADCKACFIDIEPDTFCMSATDLFSKRDQYDAVIAIHMFGNLCDMKSLEEAANGKPIIEDCAQSLGSRFNGQMAGSFGTIAVFSFRSGKYLSVGEGGALFSRYADIRFRIIELVAATPSPGPAEELIHVAKTYIRSSLRSKPLYGLIGYSLWNNYNKKVDHTAKTPIVFGQIYRPDFAITRHRLVSINSAIERQRAHADYYSRNLNLNSDMLCFEKTGTFYNRYLYPITFPSSKLRDLIADYLHDQKIGTIKPYNDIAEIAATHHGYSSGDCPVTENVSKRLLAIPNNYSLKQKVVERIGRLLNRGWAEISSR